MIDKYLCSVDDTDYNVVVYHNTEEDYWYLPHSYVSRKGCLVNYFKTIFDIERELDISLNIVEHLGNGR